MSARPITVPLKGIMLAVLTSMLAVPSGTVFAQDAPPPHPQLIFNFNADPGADLKQVSISRNGQHIALAETAGVALRIDLGPPLPEALWLVVDWKGGGQFSAYPIILVHNLAGLKTDVLFVKDPASRPSKQEIQRLCGEEAVKSVEHAFSMYFTCKAAAAVEPSESKTGRAALQGWLKSNLYLVKAIRPISPFTYDPDLAERLREVILEADKRGNSQAWKPLRIEDARGFLKSSEARDVSLYPLVASLKDSGNLDGAMAVLDYVTSAYNTIVGPDGTQPVDSIDRRLLAQSREYLEKLMQAARPVASPLRKAPADNVNVIENSHASAVAAR